MTDKTDKTRRTIDWEIIERDYRAGIKTLRQIAAEAGITHGAINKRAKVDGWERDLRKKILAKAEAKVSKAQVSSLVSKEARVSDAAVVEANAEIVASADLLNRKDVVLAIGTGRQQLEELANLGRPEFAERLEWLGELMLSPDDKGVDKANDLYRYVIGLSGRVKNLKDVIAGLATMIQIQRKILKLDQDANNNQAEVDDLLRKINASDV